MSLERLEKLKEELSRIREVFQKECYSLPLMPYAELALTKLLIAEFHMTKHLEDLKVSRLPLAKSLEQGNEAAELSPRLSLVKKEQSI